MSDHILKKTKEKKDNKQYTSDIKNDIGLKNRASKNIITASTHFNTLKYGFKA